MVFQVVEGGCGESGGSGGFQVVAAVLILFFPVAVAVISVLGFRLWCRQAKLSCFGLSLFGSGPYDILCCIFLESGLFGCVWVLSKHFFFFSLPFPSSILMYYLSRFLNKTFFSYEKNLFLEQLYGLTLCNQIST